MNKLGLSAIGSFLISIVLSTAQGATLNPVPGGNPLVLSEAATLRVVNLGPGLARLNFFPDSIGADPAVEPGDPVGAFGDTALSAGSATWDASIFEGGSLFSAGFFEGNLFSFGGLVFGVSVVDPQRLRFDFSVGIQNFGSFGVCTVACTAADFAVPPAAVPLPAALPLLATGLVALGALGLRRRRAA